MVSDILADALGNDCHKTKVTIGFFEFNGAQELFGDYRSGLQFGQCQLHWHVHINFNVHVHVQRQCDNDNVNVTVEFDVCVDVDVYVCFDLRSDV